MHMADALLTPAVAGVMYAASAVVAGASIVELHKEEKQDLTSAAKKLPTMAVMSALVFAGQMINYTIPGTGSSGHLCGGLLLTSVLGPWAGFLSMIVILTIQCLFFADGGLLALGANVWNMAFYGCFVGYFLIYRPLMRSRCFARRGERAANRLKITLASVLGCVLTLQLGAFSVVLETTLSGITDLPFGAFCAIMQPIHLAIGLIEGLITAAVLLFLYEARPELLRDVRMSGETAGKVSFKGTIAVIAIAAVLGNVSELPAVKNAFAGIRVGVAVLMINSVIKLAKAAIVDWKAVLIFLAVFGGAVFTPVSPMIYIVATGVAGILLKTWEV